MPLLEIRDLKKTFAAPGGVFHCVLDIPHFALEPGEHALLRGESGLGKTTFLHSIAGILAPDEGSILLDGADMAALSESARDRRRAALIGYVFQTFNLLQGFTVLENVLLGMTFGSGAALSHARELLQCLGLAAHEDHFPRQLSIGQQQRVALARALAHRPRLVLGDEPTANLDSAAAARAMELLHETCRSEGAALLMVSHSRDVEAGFDRVIELATLNRAAARTAAPHP
ncbi:MAG: ABC transporter ATP-binding protein [Opitutaceae bacterium]